MEDLFTPAGVGQHVLLKVKSYIPVSIRFAMEFELIKKKPLGCVAFTVLDTPRAGWQ